MSEPKPFTEPPLRPRWRAWRRQGILSIPLFLATGALPLFNWGTMIHLLLWLTMMIIVTYFLGVAWFMSVEYRMRPVKMHFWEVGLPLPGEASDGGSEAARTSCATTSLVGQDLSTSSLRNGDLREMDLAGMDLSARDLSGANLRSARLAGAQLSNANLHGANMSGVVLSGADLSGADLRKVRFGFCILTDANFRGADLRGADFVGSGEMLVVWDSNLGGADFRGALYDRTTRWPLGFNPERRGCIHASDSVHALPIPSEAEEEEQTNTLPVTVEGVQQEPLQPATTLEIPAPAAQPEPPPAQHLNTGV